MQTHNAKTKGPKLRVRHPHRLRKPNHGPKYDLSDTLLEYPGLIIRRRNPLILRESGQTGGSPIH